MLLLPSAYGWYTLQVGSSGSLTKLLSSGGIYANPLAFLLPTLFITGLALLVLRLLPAVISILAWAFERLPGTVPVLVLRQLSRAASAYQGPLLLDAGDHFPGRFHRLDGPHDRQLAGGRHLFRRRR